AIDSVCAVAAERLGVHTERASGDLDAKKALIDAQLATMNGELAKVTGLVRQLEGDRARTFSVLSEQLRSAGEQTARLAETTQSLREALSSTTARGQWGERMAEDVLRLAGFVENVNYRKQRAIAEGRPDFTFLLPRDMQLHMDVKFPLDNYLRYLDATTDGERDAARTAFLRDVRARVRELSRREYAAGEDCLDCVLLFIPNEQLYAFIQQTDAAAVEEALRSKVVFCSPLTLFAVLAVVRQAMDNFMLERTSNEILSQLGAFRRQWDKFSDQVDKLGRGLQSATRAYDELVTTRTRQLQRPLDKLDDLRVARGLAVAGDDYETPALSVVASGADG
ncbi:MAG: DNA recombination protein RmuC, partial [Actinomycetota bacterium]|nr:DNA recombination protein RmuC [Actinomycetota bacterium]